MKYDDTIDVEATFDNVVFEIYQECYDDLSARLYRLNPEIKLEVLKKLKIVIQNTIKLEKQNG